MGRCASHCNDHRRRERNDYPVIDDYSRTDHQAWILAHCVQQQFDSDNLAHVRQLAPRVIELGNFVTENIHRFGIDDEERRRVADAWTALVRHVEALTSP